MCETEDHTEHLIYDCKNVKSHWQKVSLFLNFDDTWKVILLKFYHETTKKTRALNN